MGDFCDLCDYAGVQLFTFIAMHCFRWTFHLYDLNGDGVITKDEMEDVTASVELTFEFSPSSSIPTLVTIQTDSIHSKSRISWMKKSADDLEFSAEGLSGNYQV